MNKIYLSALALLVGSAINAQVTNPSFENWTSGDPDGWTTNNVFAAFGDITDGSGNTISAATEIMTGATNGNSSLKLTSFNLANSTDSIAPDGDYGGILLQDVVTTNKYADFSFDLKYDIKTNDTAIIAIQAFNAAGSLVGSKIESFAGIQSSFGTTTIAMTYSGSVAEYTIFMVSSEAQVLTNALSTIAPGSFLEVDNIVLGAIIPDAPLATNIVATDVSSNNNGSDLEISFDIPDETNVSNYYVLAMTSAITPDQLNDDIGFLLNNGIQIAPDGANQTYNFTAAGEYWKLNAGGTALEVAPIVENEEMIVYVLVEGTNGYSSVYAGSNAITLTSLVSVVDQYKEISIYPNPANSFVNFKVDGLVNGTIMINSVSGQEVVNTQINGTKKVNVSHLNNGIYIYTLHNQNGEVVKTNKLVIRK
jgi:hypothetical protein